MTPVHIYAKPQRVPRAKQFPIRIVLPLSAEMAAKIDLARLNDEARVDFIREAVEREIKRRQRR